MINLLWGEHQWNQSGEAVGLSALVISVALLGWELNQANRLAQATKFERLLSEPLPTKPLEAVERRYVP